MEIKPFPNSIPEELWHANRFMYNAKFDKALELITSFEKRETSTSKDQLLGLILKGRIYCYLGKYKEAVEVGELAFQSSQKLGKILESIDALLLKAQVVYLGKTEQAFDFILEAEKSFKSITRFSTSSSFQRQVDILLMKSIICRYKGDLNNSLELVEQCLTFQEKISEKLDISRIYQHFVEVNHYIGEYNTGLSYAQKSLALFREIGSQVGIANSLYLVAMSYYTKGNFDQSLKICKQSLAIDEISVLTKLESLHLLGLLYKDRGEINRTIRYYNRAVKIAKKEGYVEEIINNIMGIGATYRMKGDLDRAITYLKQSLSISKKINSPFGIKSSLFYIILANLDKDSLDQAKLYLTQLEQYTSQTKSVIFNQIEKVAKALVLKKSGRIRNRTEAELLLKQIIENKTLAPILYRYSMVNLCDLFLEELYITNNPEVLDELNPLINNLFTFAENQNAYSWLAETKLIQAKLALIQMDFDKTKKLLTQAQRIAEIHGLSLLASKISSEHDNLLEHLNEWVNLQKSGAPMSERIKLASFKGVVDRMKGKGAIQTPKLIHEEPVLLLIIGEGGFPLFSTQFGEKLPFEEDLVSAFLSAFNAFSSELFSKGLDRAKFGEHMILIQPVNSYSVCYLFKGQTYLAKQKLNKFTEEIRSTNSIWQTLNKYYKTSRAIKLKDLPPLESLISEIFIS